MAGGDRMRAKFIEQLRKKFQLTKAYLAEQLGMSRPTYMQLECGERDLTVPEAEKLAEIFGLSLEDFLAENIPDISIKITKNKTIAKKAKNEIRINIPQQKLDKFKQVLLYILKKVGGKPNIGMTAIYKLLYFIDFDYYEKYEEQLMGLIFIKNHFGPTPIVFDKIIQQMIDDNQIERIKSKYYKHEQTKYLINPEIEPDLSILNGQEKEHIDWELQRLSNLNAATLSNFSHNDVPWIGAQFGEQLDYEAVFYRTADTSIRNYNNDD
jgi:transcriptional regulator with XRE-family HTH domain